MLPLLLAMLAAGSGLGGASMGLTGLVCPAEIIVKEHALGIPKGFRARHGEARRKLSGVGFFSGPPEDLAALVPDEETPSKTGTVAVWRFVGGKERIFVSCHYQGTATTLERELPAEVRTCRVSFERQPEGNASLEVRSIACER
jgi:hypothetical protein